MSCNGKTIFHCSSPAGCGNYKCCDLGQAGTLKMFPAEWGYAPEDRLGHLEIVDEDCFGGKAVGCRAKDTATCDNGYKPIHCQIYPVWIEYGYPDHLATHKSQACPLTHFHLGAQRRKAQEILDGYVAIGLATQDELFRFTTQVVLPPYEQYKQVVRRLGPEHLGEIEHWEAGLPDDPDIVIRSSRSDIQRCLGPDGISYGVYHNDMLAAYTLSYMDAHKYSLIIEKSVTSVPWRGNGFQTETTSLILDEAKAGFDIKVATVTVSSSNSASLASLKKHGFVEIGRRQNICGTVSERMLLELKFE